MQSHDIRLHDRKKADNRITVIPGEVLLYLSCLDFQICMVPPVVLQDEFFVQSFHMFIDAVEEYENLFQFRFSLAVNNLLRGYSHTSDIAAEYFRYLLYGMHQTIYRWFAGWAQQNNLSPSENIPRAAEFHQIVVA